MIRFLNISFIVFLSILSSFGKTTVVKGHIGDYPLEDETSLAIITIYNLQDDPRQIRREIGRDGSFELAFELDNTQDVILGILRMNLKLLVVPGDTLILTWNYEDGETHVSFNGDGARRNHHMTHMMNTFQKEIDYSSGEPKGINAKYKEYTPTEFLTYRLKVKEQERSVLETYLIENEVEDSLLLAWVRYFIDFQPMAHLLLYQTRHAQLNGKRPLDVDMPESYYEFFKGVQISNKSGLICSSYIKFLSSFYYIVKYTELLKWPPYSEQIERDGLVSATFHGLSATTDDFAREVVLSKFLWEMMGRRDSLSQQVPPIMEAYFEVATDRNLISTTMKRFELVFNPKHEIKHKDHVSLLDFREEEKLLPNLVQKFQGDVIVIDIWATWCAPCLVEMQFYPKLVENYSDEKVTFVFLAAFSPRKLWEQTINDLELPGQHYFLSEKEYYALEEYFELKGFPQHIIIDSEGNIVNELRGRIYDNSNGDLDKELLALLDGLLAK